MRTVSRRRSSASESTPLRAVSVASSVVQAAGMRGSVT